VLVLFVCAGSDTGTDTINSDDPCASNFTEYGNDTCNHTDAEVKGIGTS
jgi:hypothetical protein